MSEEEYWKGEAWRVDCCSMELCSMRLFDADKIHLSFHESASRADIVGFPESGSGSAIPI